MLAENGTRSTYQVQRLFLLPVSVAISTLSRLSRLNQTYIPAALAGEDIFSLGRLSVEVFVHDCSHDGQFSRAAQSFD